MPYYSAGIVGESPDSETASYSAKDNAHSNRVVSVSNGEPSTGDEISFLDKIIPHVQNFPHISTRQSTGHLSPLNVCGADERIEVKNTKVYPNSAVCFLEITFWDGKNEQSFIGTGFLYSAQILYTAGHCIHDAKLGWARRIRIWPGRSGSNAPFGGAVCTNFYVPPEWLSSHSPDFDYGAVIIDSPGFPKAAVYGFGTEARPAKYLVNEVVRTIGFPGDKPYGTQWETKGKIETVGARRFNYMFDTAGGQSGSPVFTVNTYGTGGRVHFVLGIHTYGGCPNSATRVIEEMQKRLPT